MGDVTSIFILESLQVWRQTADVQWLQAVWPSVIAAVGWEVERSSMVKGLDLPNAVDTTYVSVRQLCSPLARSLSFARALSLFLPSSVSLALRLSVSLSLCVLGGSPMQPQLRGSRLPVVTEQV